MSSQNTKLTWHGKNRIKERCGIPKRAAKRQMDIAFENGLTHSETNGCLKKYLDKVFLLHNNANNMRVWNGNLYIFIDNTLITVYKLDAKLRKKEQEIRKKKGATRFDEQ